MALKVLAVRADACSEALDLEIKCQQTVFRVHRAVVCAKSTVLAALCGNEAAQTTIEVHETDSDTFKAVLNYMYTGDYELENEIFGNIATTPTSTFFPKSFEELRCEEYDASRYISHHLREHTHVFVLGDVYQVTGLKLYAAQKFRATAKRLKAFSSRDFAQIATAIFTRDDLDMTLLCDELVAMAVDHKLYLAHDHEFLNAVSTRPGLQRFVRPLIEALATPLPRVETASSCKEPDSFAQMVDVQQDVPQCAAISEASIHATLEALRSEHDEATKALNRKHEAEISSLELKHQDALQDAKTGLPTPQNRRELLDHLNGLAGQITVCKRTGCRARPLPYTIEFQSEGTGFVARCTQCATKHSL